MKWIQEAIRCNTSTSSKRVALLISVSALAVSTLILSIAAALGREVAAAIASVATPLAAIGGWSYTQGTKNDSAPPA